MRRWVAPAVLAAVAVVALLAAARNTADDTRRELDATVREGLFLLRRGNQTDGASASKLFARALSIDPEFAFAKAATAEASARLGNEAFGLAVELARDAVATDSSCGDCRTILAYVLLTRAWNWTESRSLLERAVAERPTDVYARIWHSLWLTVNGRVAEALIHAEEAVRLDPASDNPLGQLAMVNYFSGRYEASLEASQQAAQLNPQNTGAHYWRFRSLMMLGQHRDAAAARAEAVAAWDAYPRQKTFELIATYHRLVDDGGPVKLADYLLGEVAEGHPRRVISYDRAVWQMWAGRPEAALDELRDAVAARPYRVIFAAADPVFSPLRAMPAFRPIAEGLGLPLLPAD